MLFRVRLFILGIVALLMGITCTTKDGIEFEEGKGSILVVSQNADSARIFLNYHDTGQRTPALLQNVTPGRQVLHLFLNTFKSSVDSIVVFLEEDQTDTATFTLVPSPSGDLTINSTPDSARILLNKLEFGFTPLTVDGLPEGVYFLQLLKSNFDMILDTLEIVANDEVILNYRLQEDLRRFVILEHFSNTSCPPCPQSDAIIDDLAGDYGAVQLVVLAYHANFPSPSDPMYLSAKPDNDSRLQFYLPPSIPRAFVDGRLVQDPLSEQSYRNLIDSQLQQDTALTISFTQLNRSYTLIQGKLELKALQSIAAGHQLQIALIEDEIDYPSPPGTNGQTHFEAVLRALYPDGAGIPVTMTPQQILRVDFSFILKSEWGEDLTVLAFVQNLSDKSILQSGWTRYPPF
ncbi:MAG: PEGA domain-containing protein [bacterium]|nr:MAG: PEGA domain-containing protein [bacterium]